MEREGRGSYEVRRRGDEKRKGKEGMEMEENGQEERKEGVMGGQSEEMENSE